MRFRPFFAAFVLVLVVAVPPALYLHAGAATPRAHRPVLVQGPAPISRTPNALAAADAAIAAGWWLDGLRLHAIIEFAAAFEQVSTQRASYTISSGAAASSGTLSWCGGDLPPCYVKARELGGDYGAVNPTGCSGRSCGGAWQFDPVTWAGYGGYASAELAPAAVQDARAREVWAGGAGCGAWSACG